MRSAYSSEICIYLIESFYDSLSENTSKRRKNKKIFLCLYYQNLYCHHMLSVRGKGLLIFSPVKYTCNEFMPQFKKGGDIALQLSAGLFISID